MSVVLVETQLLEQLKDLFISQLPNDTRGHRNVLKYAYANSQLLIELDTNLHISQDAGYGCRIEDYIYTMKLNMNGTTYLATIKYHYNGGSCEECDRVSYANSGSYQDEDHIVDPKEYMIGQIRSLKFHTLAIE